jgi:hypothetical protein
VPYSDTVTAAFAVFAFGAYVAVPGPEVFVHVPIPILGTALKLKFRLQTVPPVPAFAVGCGLTVFVIPEEVTLHPVLLTVG